MRISVFGLGYVGAVTAACFARDGHRVVGVDNNPSKVAAVSRGESLIIEDGLADLLATGAADARIRGTGDVDDAVASTDVSVISVGTPLDAHGRPELSYVYTVCREIGAALRDKTGSHAVVLRSTVPPGTLSECAEILRSAAGCADVHTAFNPEFLREGSAIRDYDAPPYTIIGTQSHEAERVVREMYATVNAPIHVVQPEVAELIKYVSNSWHATKIAFANEIGRLAKGFRVDGRDVMNLVVEDTKLNASGAYLRPGFAYGGSCLPKDLGALRHFARQMHVDAPLLDAVPRSNGAMIEAAFRYVMRRSPSRVAILGLAFKAGTDDLRESPAVPLVKRLLGEGIDVRIFDEAVEEARLIGTNRAYIEANLPHFVELMTASVEDAMRDADTVVITHPGPGFAKAVERVPRGTQVLDLAGAFDPAPNGMDYHGLAW